MYKDFAKDKGKGWRKEGGKRMKRKELLRKIFGMLIIYMV